MHSSDWRPPHMWCGRENSVHRMERASSFGTDTSDDDEQEERKRGMFAQLIDGIFYNNPKFWESTSYLVFVAIFCIVAISAQGGASDPVAFHFTKDLKKIFAEFEQITTIQAWYLLPSLSASHSFFDNHPMSDWRAKRLGIHYVQRTARPEMP